jgi:hypothetical protein
VLLLLLLVLLVLLVLRHDGGPDLGRGAQWALGPIHVRLVVPLLVPLLLLLLVLLLLLSVEEVLLLHLLLLHLLLELGALLRKHILLVQLVELLLLLLLLHATTLRSVVASSSPSSRRACAARIAENGNYAAAARAGCSLIQSSPQRICTQRSRGLQQRAAGNIATAAQGCQGEHLMHRPSQRAVSRAALEAVRAHTVGCTSSYA